jgi:hypothetical protein
MTLENDDLVQACLDLAGRAGATGVEIGFVREDVPSEQAGWFAFAKYRGARISVEEQTSPATAALSLAHRILRGARCRCGDMVSLSDRQPGCRWRLEGARWQPGCNAPTMKVPEGLRGDYTGMARVYAEQAPANRRERRRRRGSGPTRGWGQWLGN